MEWYVYSHLTLHDFFMCHLDYGESHYIGPIKGAQPNSEAWVNGFDHIAWLHLCGSFAREFKARPRHQTSLRVNEDRVYVWARPHPRDAEASGDPVGKPMNFELVSSLSYSNFHLLKVPRTKTLYLMRRMFF